MQASAVLTRAAYCVLHFAPIAVAVSYNLAYAYWLLSGVPNYRSAWGVHDDTLFEFAIDKLDALADGDSPFALVLLTLDTHHPSGLPSGSCPSRGQEASDMEFAIRCSDRLLSGFIDDVLSLPRRGRCALVGSSSASK